MQTLLSLDTDILIMARGWTAGFSDTQRMMLQFWGESVVIGAMMLLLGLWFFGLFQKKTEYKVAALSIFWTIILTFVAYLIINLGIPQFRVSPQEVAGTVGPIINHALDNSFPSGHALFTAALFVGLLTFFRRGWLILIFLILGGMTALTRVMGGVHYPWDIIGGWIIGTLGALIAIRIIRMPFFQKFEEWIIRVMGHIKL